MHNLHVYGVLPAHGAVPFRVAASAAVLSLKMTTSRSRKLDANEEMPDTTWGITIHATRNPG